MNAASSHAEIGHVRETPSAARSHAPSSRPQLPGDARVASDAGVSALQSLESALADLQAAALGPTANDADPAASEAAAALETALPDRADAASNALTSARREEAAHPAADSVVLPSETAAELSAQAEKTRSGELLATATPAALAAASPPPAAVEGAVGFPQLLAAKDAKRKLPAGDGGEGDEKRRDARSARWEMLRQMRDAYGTEPPPET